MIYPYLLFWAMLSFFANSKVSIFTNGIMTGITSCLDTAVNWVLDVQPEHLNQSQETVTVLANQGFTCKQLVIMYTDCLIKPVLIVNLILFMICLVRSYWIEKYNHGIDISLKTIEDYSDRIIFKEVIKDKLNNTLWFIIIKVLNYLGIKF